MERGLKVRGCHKVIKLVRTRDTIRSKVRKILAAAKRPSPATLDPDKKGREGGCPWGPPRTWWVGLHVQGLMMIVHTVTLPCKRLGVLGFPRSIQE